MLTVSLVTYNKTSTTSKRDQILFELQTKKKKLVTHLLYYLHIFFLTKLTKLIENKFQFITENSGTF